MRGVVVPPHTAAVSLTQELAAEHGSSRHVGDVRVEGGAQVLRQSLAGSLEMRGCDISVNSWTVVLEILNNLETCVFTFC